jgi:hypothetical protein
MVFVPLNLWLIVTMATDPQILETSIKVDDEHFDRRRRHLAIVSAGKNGTGFKILPRRLPLYQLPIMLPGEHDRIRASDKGDPA